MDERLMFFFNTTLASPWLGALSRRLRPLTPDPLCVHPQALLAEWRVRRAGG